MAKHGENIYKRKDGRWEARVIKGYTENGKALYAYIYGRTYREAKEKIFNSLTYTIENVVSAKTTTAPNFESVLVLWLDRKRIGIKESSYVKYFNLMNNHIKPYLGKYPISSIDSAVLNSFIAEKLKINGLSEKTMKDIMTVIKSVLRFAKEEGLITEIDFKINLPREKQKDMRVLTKDEQTLLEKYLCSEIDENKLGVLVCLYTGLRVGEICALKWSDISLDENTLTVSRTMQRIQTLNTTYDTKTKVFVTDPKSDCSARVIPLPDFLIKKLKMFRPAYENAYLLTGKPERYIEPRTYQNRFKSYITGSGIKHANFHCCRHTFATRCVEVGFEIKSLSEILGHANVNITLNRYVHPSFDLKRSNMNKLACFY
ncbi:MAG: site-specific integrase [Oscillospiraceae bacterium]|nr:site-specific integrase [Oscillospiraceae bacterium]